MPKQRIIPASEPVQVSLGVRLLDFDEADPMSDQTWAGAEEVLSTVDLSKHPSAAETLRFLLERGWESQSVTGLLLAMWMTKSAPAGDVAADLLALEPKQRRVLTALYASTDGSEVVQYSVSSDGTLLQHTYSHKSLAVPDIRLYAP